MPRYFFHVTGDRPDLDRDGVELLNLEAARREALQFAATILQDHPEVMLDKASFHVDVADRTGLSLYTVAIRTGDGSLGKEARAERLSIH